MCSVDCLLTHGRHVRPWIMTRNVLAPATGYAILSQPTPKQFTLMFADVTYVYHPNVWHVYKANW